MFHLLLLGQTVLYPVPFLRPFRVVPLLHGSYQVAGNPADALEGDALPNIAGGTYRTPFTNWLPPRRSSP